MKMTCNVMEDLLPLYLDGVCSEDTKALVEEHVKDCPACRAKLEQMREEIKRPQPHLEEGKPIKAIAIRWKRGTIRKVALGMLAAIVLTTAVIFGSYSIQRAWYMYFYHSGIIVPAADISVLDAGEDEQGMAWFELNVLTEKTPRYGWGGWFSEDGTTLYLNFRTTRRDPNQLRAEPNEPMIFEYWSTFSSQELLSSWKEQKETQMVQEKLEQYEQISRVVYQDGDGNELVIYDKSAQ